MIVRTPVAAGKGASIILPLLSRASVDIFFPASFVATHPTD